MKEDEILLRDILDDHSVIPMEFPVSQILLFRKNGKPETGNSCLLEIILRMAKLNNCAHIEGSALAKACASIMCGELINLTRQDAH